MGDGPWLFTFELARKKREEREQEKEARRKARNSTHLPLSFFSFLLNSLQTRLSPLDIPELLHMVLQHVVDDTLSGAAVCLLVNQTWFDVGAVLLWREVRFEDCSFVFQWATENKKIRRSGASVSSRGRTWLGEREEEVTRRGTTLTLVSAWLSVWV